MKIAVTASLETWAIRGSFTISRGAKSEAKVVVVRMQCDGHSGSGECVPYARYGESIESVLSQIKEFEKNINTSPHHSDIIAKMSPGAARNAVDCAFWDLEAKRTGIPVHATICKVPPAPVTTAVTISLGDPRAMARAAQACADRPLLKVKLGGDTADAERIHAVAAAAPKAAIILDANEGWHPDEIEHLLGVAAQAGVRLVEQPLPAGNDGMLAEIAHPVPICADESAHTSADLEALRGRYDCVNIKLDKTGGLTEALAMRDRAHRLGFSVMVGCMVATSLSMAPAVLLAQGAEYADLDGPLLLARDRQHGLVYNGAMVSPPDSNLWG